ncbi:RNA-directed DNA polymerase, eukaryota [Tanacetum coccineum]
MLKGFDREDLVTLWSLVKERFRSAEPTEDKERALWVELKRLFEPDKDDVLWKLQRYMYDPLTWRLGDFSSKSFIILEAVASQDFLDQLVFYGIFGVNNKINVICQSPLFSDLKAGKAQEEVEFQANEVTYKWGYYLVNEIYMEWDTLIKSTSNLSAGDTKRIRNEDFTELEIRHVGGFWIWIQFPSSSLADNFQTNSSLKSVYSCIKSATPSFKVDEHMIWIGLASLYNINIVDEKLDSSDNLDVNGMEKIEDSVDENSLPDLNDLKETINELASNKIQHPISK